MRILRVQRLLSLLVFLLTWIVLAWFGESEAAVRWLRERPIFSFLNATFLDVFLQYLWQPLLATFATLAIQSRLKSAAEHLEGRLFPPFFLELSTYRTRDAAQGLELDFRAREFELIGRSSELEKLNGFLSTGKRVSWWSVNGLGGSGKSRLVLEWMLSLDRPRFPILSRGYDAGFLTWEVGEDTWAKWMPRRPTVVAIDDAGRYVEEIVRLLEELGRKAHRLRHAVWIVLVERDTPTKLKRLEADPPGQARCHSLEPLIVSPFGLAECRRIGRALERRRDKKLEFFEEAIEEVLRISDGLPLYVFLAMESWIEHGGPRWDRREDLFSSHVARLRDRLRKHGFEEPSLPVFALATLTHGLPWDEAVRFAPESADWQKTALDGFFQQDTAEGIPAVKPEPVGEYFVLQQVGRMKSEERRRLIKTAWQLKPESMSLALHALIRDFPNHEQVPHIWYRPERQHEIRWWAHVHALLLSDLSEEHLHRSWQELVDLGEAYPDFEELAVEVAQGAESTFFHDKSVRGALPNPWEVLLNLSTRFRHSKEIQLQLSRAGTSAILECTTDTAELSARLETIIAVSSRFPAELWIQEEAAQAVSIAIPFLGSQGRLRALQALKSIAGRHVGVVRLQARLAEGATLLTVSWNEELADSTLTTLPAALECLDGLARRYPDSSEIQEQVTTGLANAITGYQDDEREAELRSTLERLRDFALAWPDNVTVQANLGRGARAATTYYAITGAVDDMEKALAIVEGVGARFPASEEIQELVVNALSDASVAYSELKNWSELRAVEKRANDLAGQFPKSAEIQESAAWALANALAGYAEHRQESDLARTLDNLHTVAARFPDSVEIHRQVTRGLADAMMGYGKLKAWANVRSVLDDLRSVGHLFEDEEIQKYVIAGLADAIAYLSVEQSWRELAAPLETLQEIASRFPNSVDIQREAVRGWGNAVVGYGECERGVELDSALQSLGEIAHRFLDHPEVRDLLAKALVDAISYAAGDDATKSALTKELRQLWHAYPQDSRLHARLAEAEEPGSVP